jgi:hypothetical protein
MFVITMIIDDVFIIVLYFYHRAAAITAEQTKVVTALIEADDAAVRRVFVRYEKEKDLSKLIQYLRTAKLQTYALSVS